MLERAPAALLMAYGGLRRSLSLELLLEFVKIGTVSGSTMIQVGICCWNGLSNDKGQNCIEVRDMSCCKREPYVGFRNDLLFRLVVDFVKIGVEGSGGRVERGGGIFRSIACWNGLSHGKRQNCI